MFPTVYSNLFSYNHLFSIFQLLSFSINVLYSPISLFEYINMFYKFCFENTVHTLIQYCKSFLSISFFEHVCSLYSYYIFSLYSFLSTFSYISNYYFPSYFLILLFLLNLCFSRVL